ncbi:MAG: epimerase [Cytophagales bacterium]|nr:epimerase [Cytophaga sp.]
MKTSKSQFIKAIITGTTGMVGEGVLHECLLSPDIEAVLVINRKACGVSHPKLKEIIHNDFFNFSAIEHSLSGYNACFFCLGVSSVGMKEPEYYKMTYTLTMHVAVTLSKLNTDMTFCYVSGAGTDTSEKGTSMWARVKGKTENDLKKLPFADVYAFRPGYMHPTKGLKNTLSSYAYLKWMYPFFRAVFPKLVTTLKEVGLAMIYVSKHSYEKKIIDTTDIVLLAQKESAQ